MRERLGALCGSKLRLLCLVEDFVVRTVSWGVRPALAHLIHFTPVRLWWVLGPTGRQVALRQFQLRHLRYSRRLGSLLSELRAFKYVKHRIEFFLHLVVIYV